MKPALYLTVSAAVAVTATYLTGYAAPLFGGAQAWLRARPDRWYTEADEPA